MAEIFLFGNLRSSLTLARTLSKAGHGIHAGFDTPDPYLFRSRHVRGAVRHGPLDREPELALRTVNAYLDQHPEIEALIPVSEVATRLVSRHRECFPARVRLVLAEDRLVEACSDKAGLFELCDRLGVRLARRLLATDLTELCDAVADVGFPCIVKPVESTEWVFGEKAVVFRTQAEADERLQSWPEGHRTLCVQSFVEGPRHNVYFGASQGRLLGAAEIEIRRTDKANGVGYAVEGVSVKPMAAVRRATEALIEALDYTGVGCVQVMVDARSRRISFLEINPRLGANYKIAETCGLPLSVWMYELACGVTPEAEANPWAYPAGRTYVHSKGDLGGLKNELKSGALSAGQAARWALQALRGLFRANHLTFSWRDPWPTFWLYFGKPLGRLRLDPARDPRWRSPTRRSQWARRWLARQPQGVSQA